nr:ribosomal protein S3 [Coptis chinensis]
MARKGNPISVRLDLNRSSDPSRFSDYYYGKSVYQDVNLRSFFGSIRPPTRRTFGFRLGRCIIIHFPKRTFIHFFLPRRPRKRRYKSRPGKKKGRKKKVMIHRLKTLPVVCSSWNYSVMQYLLNTKNKMHFDPIVVLKHFVAPGLAEPSTMGGANEQGRSLDKRIRSRIAFFVESSTSEKSVWPKPKEVYPLHSLGE